MLQIKTSDYNKVYKIEVDGEAWEMRPLGAGDELRLSQAQRRVTLLDQKIKNGTATDADYDLYDTLEKSLFDVFAKMFKDTTKDNEHVKEWVANTPISVITKAVESIKGQVESNADATDKA